MRCADAPWWLLCALTVAAESLLPEAEQHVQTHTAISRLIKVLHPPDVLPIFLYHLWVRGGQQKSENGLKQSRMLHRKLNVLCGVKCAVPSPSSQAGQAKARCSCLLSATPPMWLSHCHPHLLLSSCLWAPVTFLNRCMIFSITPMY